MAIGTSTPATPPASPTIPIYRLSVEQYLAMGRAGILTEDDRVELIEGWITPKMTKNPPHGVALGLLQDVIGPMLPRGWFSMVEMPLDLGDSMPEPDLMLVRGARRDYRDRHPTSSEVALIVEVADTSLERDRTFKKRIYARAGVVCYWIVDLAHSIVEVATEPSGPTSAPDYAKVERVGADGYLSVRIEAREVGRISVAEILP